MRRITRQGEESIGKRFQMMKNAVNIFVHPNQQDRYVHYDYKIILANTENTSPQYLQKTSQNNTFQTVQPQYIETDYEGRQQQQKIISKRQKTKKQMKSNLQQYYKTRTDQTTIRGNDNIRQQDFDKDLQDTLQHGFPDPFIRYKIIPADQYKMALDVTTINNEKLTKGNIIIWDYHGGPNQHFYLKKARGDNQFFIINSSTGFVLQVPNSSTDDQVQVRMTPRANTLNQIWKLQPCGTDLFLIRSFCGKVLDVMYHWMINGVAVIQYYQNGGANQKWRIWPS